MPLEQQLWDDLISNKTENGIPLAVYEQDWLYNEWEGLAGVRGSPTLARDWLIQMASGAAKQNVTVQYCMSLSRMILQTLEAPAVRLATRLRLLGQSMPLFSPILDLFLAEYPQNPS